MENSRINPPPLIRELVIACENKNISIQQMVDSLGITRTYFVSLVNGHKEISRISLPTLRLISRFLNRPLTEVELLAGIKTPEDFIIDQDINHKLLTIYRQMSVDPDINHHVTFALGTWKELPLDVRILVAVLYESYIGEQLFKRPEIPVLEKKAAKSRKS